jgi:apolipoprotein D and lipocalin family protein
LRDERALRRLGVLLGAVAIACGAAASAGAQVEPASIAALPRFDGVWYEIASYGSWWQRGCTRDATLSVAVRSETEAVLGSRSRAGARVGVRNGRLVAPRGADHWKARFAPAIVTWLPAVWGDFWVLGHDEGLTWFVVGERDHVRLSVFSRRVALDEASLAQAMALARRAGFDVGRLTRVVHDGTTGAADAEPSPRKPGS